MGIAKRVPRLQVMGGFGEPSPPALAFDLLGGEALDAARKAGKALGVTRYGPRGRGDLSPDARPLGLEALVAVAPVNARSNWNRTRGDGANDAQLKSIPAAFGGGNGLAFYSNEFPNAWEFNASGFLEHDEAFGIRAFVSDVSSAQDSKSVKGHVIYWRFGVAGRGWKLQIKDGDLSLLHLSPGWNPGDEQTLHLLWQLDEPTDDETEQARTLSAKIYDVSESPSFEGGLGRDEWRGQLWSLLLLPEPRGDDQSGALHLLLAGGAGAVIDLGKSGDFLDSNGKAHIPVGALWNQCGLTVGATGGALDWQILSMRNTGKGTIEWGPFKGKAWTDFWNQLQTEMVTTGPGNDANGNPITSATIEKQDVDEEHFKFVATLSTTDTRYSPWVHMISARIANGPRDTTSDSTVTFDTHALEHDSGPIMGVKLRVGEDGARSADLTMRDVNGNTTRGMSLDHLSGHQAKLLLDDAPWLSGGTITRARWNNLRAFGETAPSGTVLRGGIWTARPETEIETTLDDGRFVAGEVLCVPKMIFDSLFLGEAIRRYYRRVGYTDAEITRIPSDIGPRLPKAHAGESWCVVTDESGVSQGVSGLLDRFGAGLRYGRDRDGVWFLEKVPTAIKYNFVSDEAKNDPLLIHGGTRSILLTPLVWEVDNSDYYTIFTVVGGPKGREITRSFVNRAAVTLAGGGITTPRFRGHHKYYPTLRDEGLPDEAAVLFALRSLVWRYGRPGRIAQVETYLHEDLLAWDRVTVSGITAEVKAWDGEVANPDDVDMMQLRVREII